MSGIYIIAEAGVNHNGSVDLAKKLIEKAAEAGADAVKFQAFKADSLLTANAEKASYQKETTDSSESQYDMIKKLELTHADHKELIQHAKKCEIEFLSSPFDTESIEMLAELGLSTFKVPSGEITNTPYLRQLASTGSRFIISTGMSTMPEIEKCVQVFLDAGKKLDDICLLHVNTQYPTPMCDVNLKAMVTIGTSLGVCYGYSDHTLGIEVPIAAAALGASVIEKHFTLDKTMPGPDHKASLEPDELTAMVKAVRNIQSALGDGVKKPSRSEMENIKIVRKSIVAKRDIIKGETFTENNITTKRPATGTPADRWDEVIGRTADKEYYKDEQIII